MMSFFPINAPDAKTRKVRVWGSGFRVWGSGFRVQGLGWHAKTRKVERYALGGWG